MAPDCDLSLDQEQTHNTSHEEQCTASMVASSPTFTAKPPRLVPGLLTNKQRVQLERIIAFKLPLQ